jgi:DNA-binding GntR family transcriptional regulator
MQREFMNGSRKQRNRTATRTASNDLSRPIARVAKGPRTAISTEEAYERIWNAIMDHSLPPETRLIEQRLCEIFGLGRTRLRQVLQRLAHENVVTLMPNCGAMVAKPSVQEAREVFAARRVIEAGVLQLFLRRANKADIKRISDHVEREIAAWKIADRRAALKLSGEFHLLLAEIAGNSILVELLRDLVSRSSLIIAVYQAPSTPSCPPDEHQELVTALERGQPRAVTLMLRHLDHVLADLRLQEPAITQVDLQSVLTRSAADHRSGRTNGRAVRAESPTGR